VVFRGQQTCISLIVNPMAMTTPLPNSSISPLPSLIAPAHWGEWMASGVDPALVMANVLSLEGEAVYDYLFYSPRLTRTNTGRLTAGYLREYSCLEVGGWWCSGLDPFNNWHPMLWGQFKADIPRRRVASSSEASISAPSTASAKSKVVKYEPPPKEATRAFFLAVPDVIAARIYQRAGVVPSEGDRIRGFWHCVWQYNLPIVITEGAKKAGALLTAGYAAIALPGISSGYRTPKDSDGNVEGDRHLIPDLRHFATPGRSVYFCFDHDQKPTTQAAVRLNIGITGRLFVDAGCTVLVIQLPGPEKGADDFLVHHGVLAFHELYHHALPLATWQTLQLFQLSYAPTRQIHQRYLGSIDLPSTGFVCIKSPKGTGKTALLEPVIHQATTTGRKTLVISHRVQLGHVTCDRCGIDYISDVRSSGTQGTLGFGLCIDSLHPQSQARFNPQDWKGAIVVLDECEQVLWHVLNSSTCKSQRVAILKTLKTLLQTVISTGGLIIAQDADLSDFSVDFLRDYGAIAQSPWVLVNTWQSTTDTQTVFYNTPDPGLLWLDLEKAIAQGPIYLCTDAQKASSKWGTTNIEYRLHQQFPELSILRIDSETVADPSHAAYGCIERLNTLLPHYDVVIASPSIGSGVSIDVVDHFKAVFGIFQGTIPDNEARQALARVRQPIPRYVWARPFGVGKVGNGSLDYRAIAQSKHHQQKTNLLLLNEVDFDIDRAYDPVTFRTWAKFAARVNASLSQFRQTLLAGLTFEGHQISLVQPDSEQADIVAQINQQQTEIRNQNRLAEAIAIAQAESISDALYQQLCTKRNKTRQEIYQTEKYSLEQRYGIPATPDLHLRDRNGWYRKIRLHYYLIHDAAVVHQHDRQHWRSHLQRGDGSFCPQDIHTYSEQVAALKLLDVLQFLDSDREFRGTDLAVQQCADLALQWRRELKTLFHISISDAMSPIQIVQVLLSTLDLKLTRDRRAKLPDGSRCWVYRFCPSDDPPALREPIFQQWERRDGASLPPLNSGTTKLTVSEGHPLDIKKENTLSMPLGQADDATPPTSSLSPPKAHPLKPEPPQPGPWVCASENDQAAEQTNHGGKADMSPESPELQAFAAESRGMETNQPLQGDEQTENLAFLSLLARTELEPDYTSVGLSDHPKPSFDIGLSQLQ
jgi:hypothetical protein